MVVCRLLVMVVYQLRYGRVSTTCHGRVSTDNLYYGNLLMTSFQSYIVSYRLSFQSSHAFKKIKNREAWRLVVQSVDIDTDDGRTMHFVLAKAYRQAGADIPNDSKPGLQDAIIEYITSAQERSGISMDSFLPAHWSEKRFREALVPEDKGRYFPAYSSRPRRSSWVSLPGPKH